MEYETLSVEYSSGVVYANLTATAVMFSLGVFLAMVLSLMLFCIYLRAIDLFYSGLHPKSLFVNFFFVRASWWKSYNVIASLFCCPDSDSCRKEPNLLRGTGTTALARSAALMTSGAFPRYYGSFLLYVD